MATKGGEIRYGIHFDVDVKNVTKAFDKIQDQHDFFIFKREI